MLLRKGNGAVVARYSTSLDVGKSLPEKEVTPRSIEDDEPKQQTPEPQDVFIEEKTPAESMSDEQPEEISDEEVESPNNEQESDDAIDETSVAEILDETNKAIEEEQDVAPTTSTPLPAKIIAPEKVVVKQPVRMRFKPKHKLARESERDVKEIVSVQKQTLQAAPQKKSWTGTITILVILAILALIVFKYGFVEPAVSEQPTPAAIPVVQNQNTAPVAETNNTPSADDALAGLSDKLKP